MTFVWQKIEARTVDDLEPITFTFCTADHHLVDVDRQRTGIAHGERPPDGKTWWNVSTRAIHTL